MTAEETNAEYTARIMEGVNANWRPIDWAARRRERSRRHNNFMDRVFAEPHDPEDDGGLTPPEGTFNSKICPQCKVCFVKNIGFGDEDLSGTIDRFYYECPKCGARPY